MICFSNSILHCFTLNDFVKDFVNLEEAAVIITIALGDG